MKKREKVRFLNSADLKDNEVMKDQTGCPHKMFNKDMKLIPTLYELPNGKWKCRFCGKEFNSPDDVKDEPFM